MKVVLAFDKFKGSATAAQLNAAALDAADGLDGLQCVSVPVADGGDGTAAVLAAPRDGQWIQLAVPAPLLQLPPVNASYFLCDDGTALIELAAASGLSLVPKHSLDVMRATTLGTGLMMRDAMERGSRDIVLGLGGSATCDAAMGIMCALGAEFLDADDRHLYPCGGSLEQIAQIRVEGIPQEVKDCHFTLLADVENTLSGEYGAARIYAPQKGASPQQVEQLDNGLRHVGRLAGEAIALKSGSGAAGGVPALMLHLLDCDLVPGAPYVLQRNGLVEAIAGADLVITGEGRFDSQTLMGKGPGCVIKMACEQDIPVAVVCGVMDDGLDHQVAGIKQVVAVSDGLPVDEAMDTNGTLMRVTMAVQKLLRDFTR